MDSGNIIAKKMWEEVQTDLKNQSVEEYVRTKWRKFFESDIDEKDFELLTYLVTEFRKTNQSMQAGFDFIRSHPVLMKYEKKQVGQGEFALYILFPDAEKTPSDEKGDIKMFGQVYEVKKIKTANEPIRFGTNIDLSTINDFRLVTFGLKSIFKSKEYRDGVVIAKMSSSYETIMAGSEASVTIAKLNEIYKFFKDLLEYSLSERKQKQLSVAPEDKNFVFKAADVNSDVFFKIPIKSLKTAASSGSTTATVSRTTDSQDTEELVSFGEDVTRLIVPFLKKYPDTRVYGTNVVEELNAKYKSLNVNILIIDEKNNFRVNPEFNYNSINQYVRPQVTLKRG